MHVVHGVKCMQRRRARGAGPKGLPNATQGRGGALAAVGVVRQQWSQGASARGTPTPLQQVLQPAVISDEVHGIKPPLARAPLHCTPRAALLLLQVRNPFSQETSELSI